MTLIDNSRISKMLCTIIVLTGAVTGLTGCTLAASTTISANQTELARQSQQLEKLKSAEYQDDLNAMRFENNNQKLGNYYQRKGSEAHHLINQLIAGQQVSNTEISEVLDNSDAKKYDNRPPVPLDDETGNGY